MDLWLPPPPAEFRERLQTFAAANPAARLDGLAALASHNLSPAQTRLLAKAAVEAMEQVPADGLASSGYVKVPIRIMAEWTADHLLAPLVVAGLRRRLLLDIATGDYGSLHQSLLAPPEGQLPRFILFLLDVDRRLESVNTIGDAGASAQWVENEMAEIDKLALRATEHWQATPVFHNYISLGGNMFGNHDTAIGTGPAARARSMNAALSGAAAGGGLLTWDLAGLAADIGRRGLIDARLWHHAKMLISPDAAALAADQLAALLGAALGRSRKVLVLDLDNTIWGGVIGDDGIEGIRLGQGSAEGEAFSAFQRYVKSLRSRGVVIAVASKNTHEICTAAIRQHPEMILKMDDFACFRANWDNKADNLIDIAKHLNLGLDSFVFFDDSPAERQLIRQELPMVAVPEAPADPSFYIDCLAGSHFFDAVSLSAEDLQRNEQYLGNEKRRALSNETRDLSGFLRSLDMTITIRGFNGLDLVRITQLINKTNQFNLTTRRYTEADVRAFGDDPATVVLSARVRDKFGDNGLISVVIAKPVAGEGLSIDTWLMSCRVLARDVEKALMKALVDAARRRGARFLLGYYAPTAKNKMVESFYKDQGFAPYREAEAPPAGATWWRLDLTDYAEPTIAANMEIVE